MRLHDDRCAKRSMSAAPGWSTGDTFPSLVRQPTPRDHVSPHSQPSSLPCPAVGRSRRRARQADRGVTMVEFALLSPVAVLLLMGLIVVGMLTTNVVQLNNAVRDGARAAAVCGSASRNATTTHLPTSDTTHQACTDANVRWYITSHLSAVPANLTPTIQVCDSSTQSNCTSASGSGNVIDTCQAYSKYVVVTASVRQSMYLPLVGQFFGVDAQDQANDTRLITASAEATCEQ